jgi:hypothetical protein
VRVPSRRSTYHWFAGDCSSGWYRGGSSCSVGPKPIVHSTTLLDHMKNRVRFFVCQGSGEPKQCSRRASARRCLRRYFHPNTGSVRQRQRRVKFDSIALNRSIANHHSILHRHF